MTGREALQRIAPHFWDATSAYGVHAALTDDALRTSEATLGVVLPDAYVSLLRVQNGGVVARQFSAFLTQGPTSWASDHVPFDHCSGIGPSFPTINESPYLNAEWGQPDRLVLLSGDGHFWIALDYRDPAKDEPSVVWFDNEIGQDITLADTFDEFLNGLSAPPE